LSYSVQFLSRALRNFNSLKLRTAFREMLKSPMGSSTILDRFFEEGLNLQQLQLQSCASKVCYFVKLSGSNPKNGMLFLETQDMLYRYTNNAKLFSEELLHSRIIKEFDVEALQAYALVSGIR